ncbi:MAG: hypothetical protein HY078_11840 [Elusimicrobia bacterium]|nr:hypothetical protein [Elusimicrobiota bacterium]
MAPGLSFHPTPVHLAVMEKGRPPGFASPTAQMAGVFLGLTGDVYGNMLLMFPEADADRLAATLIGQGQPIKDKKQDLYGSAIEEAGNVFGSGVIGLPSRSLALNIFTAPPKLVRDTFATIWNMLLLPQAAAPGEPVVFQAEIICPGWNSKGYFMMCLTRESVAHVDVLMAQSPVSRIDVAMGDVQVARSPSILKVASLGSCMAVILYDTKTKTGGLAHVMLPLASAVDKSVSARPGKYADIAIPALLKRINASPATLVGWLVGGANMFPKLANPHLQVGKRNMEVAREQFKKTGIRCLEEDVGGVTGRTVELFTATGEVWVRVGYPPRKLAGINSKP